MDALEKTALRFHQRLKRYHKHGFVWNMAEGNFLPAFYHAVCFAIEMYAVAYHRRQGGR